MVGGLMHRELSVWLCQYIYIYVCVCVFCNACFCGVILHPFLLALSTLLFLYLLLMSPFSCVPLFHHGVVCFVEYIVGYVFVCHQPFSSPGSYFAAFMRTLNLLATFSWQQRPLILDFERDLAAEDYRSIQNNFERLMDHSATHPSFAVVLVRDQQYELRPCYLPDAVVFQRLVQLASICSARLQHAFVRSLSSSAQLKPSVFRAIFQSSLADYDALLR
jgi:Nrap protein PAP/OAS1-like domain 5